MDPHEGPQRRPWATIGHVQVSWIYARLSWTDGLEPRGSRWILSSNLPVDPPDDGKVEDSCRPP